MRCSAWRTGAGPRSGTGQLCRTTGWTSQPAALLAPRAASVPSVLGRPPPLPRPLPAQDRVRALPVKQASLSEPARAPSDLSSSQQLITGARTTAKTNGTKTFLSSA